MRAGAWLVVVGLGYATIEQGAFYAGPFRLLLVVLGAAAVVLLASSGRERVDRRTVLFLGGAGLAAVGASVAFTGATLHSALPTAGVLLAVLAALAVGAAQDERGAAVLADGILLAGLVASCTAWAGVAWHHDPWAVVVQGVWRGASTLTYANSTGALAGACFLLALSRLTASARPSAFLVAYGLGVGVLCAGSRAAWLGVVVGMAVLAHRTRWRHVVATVAPLGAACAVAMAGLLPSISGPGRAAPGPAVLGAVGGAVVGLACTRWGRRGVLVGLVVAAVALVGVGLAHGPTVDALRASRLDAGSADRADEWRAAAHRFADHPVVGVGPGRLELTWVADDGERLRAEFVHNEYLELLATEGLLGAAALVAATVVAASAARRRGHRSAIDDGLVAALASLAVGSAFDFLWHIPLVPVVAGTMVGLLMRPSERSRP